MRTARRGFTLIELLVTVAVISILVALLLPAVQQAREAARRASCQNNLKQIGIALHTYHEMQEALPPGWVSSNQVGWTTFILPMLEQNTVYNKLNFSSKWVSDTTNPVITMKILRCPSDWGRPTLSTPSAARSTYPGVSGSTLISTATVFVSTGTSPTMGTFGENSRRRFKDFIDGQSHTTIVGERRSRGPTTNPGGDTLWIGVTDDNTQQGQAYAIGDCDPSNLLNYHGTSANGTTKGNLSGFSSVHTGGAFFLFGDGSVKFLNDSVESLTYSRLATVNDGKLLGQY